ncbi:Hermansky-Pudlak syndrome 5 [Amphibalanus amphitrite]|uniref:Hermansky-Pudlak syndrome 5 n=1 Tax=Amphibalanus amphitrite TaxID=1232801 RepID=A0A6A4V7N3_AMPAM|nr:Hermansky-Pudlak syndrome 5 [Amphibalanus amphitrite]
MEKEPFLPFEDISLEGLSQPLKGRTRIQYTCFTVSNQFIMIGTNTGGVYVFNRKSRQFVSILPGQAGAVTCLAIDPGEQLVAAGSVQGGVSVYACPTARSWSGQLTALARLDSEVRAICWRHAHWSGRLLYVGTAAGKVLSLSVSRRKSPAASATITPMLQLDSAVSELVLCGQTLLVSTLGFCYLCNVQMEVFAQVGTQPRSGRLGACFLGETVFCARPGLRLWEVRLSGQVSSTHQLKPALDEATARRVVSACDQPACLQDGGSGGGKSALGLLKLVPLSGGAVAGFSGDALFVFELAARRVLLWTSVHAKVRDLAAVGDELYVQCEGGALRRLLVRRPSQIVRELRASRGAGECARFLMSHTELTDLCRTQLPLQVLREAVRQFADDEAMQVELKRLAAVLRDRLSEDGVALGAYGYTPGLALHPEVLDAFSDLVEDVKGAVSSGAQRGTEARLGPFAARPGDAALAMELTAGAELDWLTLARLGAGLCRASPSAAAAFCVQQSDRLSALDVLYICRYAVAPGRVAAAFTAYLTAAGGSVATAVLADAELSAAAESALTAVWRQQAVGLRCQCGWPRPGAHRAPRPAAALLRRLCAARLSGQQLSEELWTLGDWTGWLQTGGDSSDRRPLAAVLCQLDDCALLQTAGPHLPSWRPVLTALAAARPDHCHSCGDPLQSVDAAEGDRRPLTVQTLLAFVTSQEGPAAAVRLLQTAAEVAPCQLTASCYRDVILSTMLNRRAPGLGRAFGAETLGLRPTPVPEDALEVLFSELGRPAPPPLPEVPAAGGCTLVSLTSDCPACCLPLRNRHLLQPHGVLTFRCGHAFHAVCLLRRDAGSCLLCRR